MPQQIADWYADQIAGGQIKPGEQLPPTDEIRDTWNVGRSSAEQAIALLRDAGLVDTGRTGVFVRRVPQIRRRAVARYKQAAREHDGSRGAFDAEIRAHGMIPRSDVEVFHEIPPADVAVALGVDPRTRSVTVRKRRMYADDVPVQLAPSYIPREIAEGTPLEVPDTGPGGMLSRLAELGYEETRITETVRVRRVTDEEREFLQLARDAPVIQIWHVGYTAEDRPVEVCVHSVPAFGWLLDYEWTTGD